MKTKQEKDGLVKKTYDIPAEICRKIEAQSKKNHRSINYELINILSEYFDDSLIKLDPTIKKVVEMYAEKKGFTITEATNYLVATKISVIEDVHEMIISEANKDYEAALATNLEKTMTGT
jgi:sulfur relay (sulfurtransferase) DsrC/TusE family protein